MYLVVLLYEGDVSFFVLLIIEISIKKNPDTFPILLYKTCILKADTFPTPVPTLLLKI
jgi:hypothetical protein